MPFKPNVSSPQPNHYPEQYPFGPIVATGTRGPIKREYYKHNHSITNDQDEFNSTAMHATKRRIRDKEMEPRGIGRDQEGIKEATRAYDDVASPTRSSDSKSQMESTGARFGCTIGRSDGSSSTLAAEEDFPSENIGEESGETECGSDGGYEGSNESGDDKSRVSSHTLGRSEDGDCETDDGDKDEDEDMNDAEEGESDDEGDLFAQNYREGRWK